MTNVLQQAATDAMAMGPLVLVPGMQVERPIDILRAGSVGIDDKRTILATWASDFYAVDSMPGLRHLPGTPEPVTIDEIQTALKELDGRDGH
ncbi:hypothetical protein JNB88_27635 [Rhizobium cauense]|uniref:hypothetical protein n=1 Tax=Rhizobium cauense TaxID=1166683 RepID=UPI001C6EDCB8|nr:hypothetical protein [Rhizobium cauense]MBW9117397.1 hypothetical protein [Rhizobium cauense]